MTAMPEQVAMARGLLDAEWARVGYMLTFAEARRTGDALPERFADSFAAAGQAVEASREAGAWRGLVHHVPDDVLAALTRLDLELMALALAPLARPALAPRFQSLQPQIGGAWPALPLVQEMLMLDGGAEVAMLFERLAPTAPLATSGLLRVEGTAPYQTVKPGPVLVRALLGRDMEIAPPPGATLSDRRGRWDSLILPDGAVRQLLDFAAWVRRAEMIHTEWGGGRVHGPLALFSGSSGTGKTFAASVIAQDLAETTGEPWALYTLDLGRIMSKYVGETEANLNALLDALDGRRAILQIDEADGLLGKRGEVSDARDRYANLEVSHLLSRFERHSGPVILTTNLRANVDTAFLRRFQLVVDFPAPDKAARARLWEVLLPPKAPRADDLDLPALAEAARLSGGSIQNTATYAAILAAEEGAPIGLRHVARAVWAELNKDGRQVRKTEIGFLAFHLEEAA